MQGPLRVRAHPGGAVHGSVGAGCPGAGGGAAADAEKGHQPGARRQDDGDRGRAGIGPRQGRAHPQGIRRHQVRRLPPAGRLRPIHPFHEGGVRAGERHSRSGPRAHHRRQPRLQPGDGDRHLLPGPGLRRPQPLLRGEARRQDLEGRAGPARCDLHGVHAADPLLELQGGARPGAAQRLRLPAQPVVQGGTGDRLLHAVPHLAGEERAGLRPPVPGVRLLAPWGHRDQQRPLLADPSQQPATTSTTRWRSASTGRASRSIGGC